jgi:hypothetical protein
MIFFVLYLSQVNFLMVELAIIVQVSPSSMIRVLAWNSVASAKALVAQLRTSAH